MPGTNAKMLIIAKYNQSSFETSPMASSFAPSIILSKYTMLFINLISRAKLIKKPTIKHGHNNLPLLNIPTNNNITTVDIYIIPIIKIFFMNDPLLIISFVV